MIAQKRNSKEFNVNTYDTALYKNKCHFFYDRSFDILFKGPDERTKSRNLAVFSQLHKKSHFKFETTDDHSTEVKTDSPNTIKTTGFRSQESFRKKKKTLPMQLSKNRIGFGSTFDLFHCPKKLTVNKSSKMYKSHSQFNIRKRNIKDIKGDSEKIVEYNNVIKDLDRILHNLDDALEREKNTESYQILKNDYGTERQKVLNIFIDYFGPMHYKKIKDRYNKLFGRDTYFKHILHATNRIMPKLGHDKSKLTREDIKEPLYVNMLYDVPNIKYIVKNKYSKCGNAKVLNVPREFLDNDIEIDKVMKRKNTVIDNVNEIYSLSNSKQKYKHDYINKLSKVHDTLRDSKLRMIRNKSDDLFERTIQTKINIVKLNTFLQKKSPLLSPNRFAYVKSENKMLYPTPQATKKKELRLHINDIF